MRKRSFQPPPVPDTNAGGEAQPIPGGGFKIATFPKRVLPPVTAEDSTAVQTVALAPAVVVEPGPTVGAVQVEHVPTDATGGTAAGIASTGFMVSLDQLDTHPWNARVHRSAARIKELSLQMSTNGQESPILVTRNPDRPGRWFVFDGETRLKAAHKLVWAELWALEREVDPKDAKEFYAASFERTDATEPISQIDQGLRWFALIEQGLATVDWLAERLEKSKPTISMMLSYGKFPSKVTDLMAEHSDAFPYSVAAELARHIGDMSALSEDQLLSLVNKIIEDNVSRRGIEAVVRQFVREPGEKRQRKAAITNKAIKRGTAQLGSLREYGNGGIELKLQPSAVLPGEAKQELLEILEAAVDALNSGETDLKKVLLERLSAQKSGE